MGRYDHYGYDDPHASPLFLYSAIFALLSVPLIWPPDEFVSAGATFETIFSSFLGDPTLNIVLYQCKKIVLNRSCVAAIPSLYAVFLILNFKVAASQVLTIFVTTAFALLAGAIVYFQFHYTTKYRHLRQMKELSSYSQDLDNLSHQITLDYKDYNNFTASFAHSQKLVVGNSWLVNINRYDFTVVNLSDVSFEAVQATTHNLSIDRANEEMQFLTIEARITNRPIKPFRFRVRSDQFRHLQDKVATQIGLARNVILHQTLSERFVKAFVDYIADNPKHVYSNVASLDMCFGCSAETPNVKIEHRCNRTVEGQPACRQCFCRPMWCVGCLARVFASKQDQERPELWLDGQATCPTCRAEFCVQDVSFVVAEEVPEEAVPE